MAQSFPETAHTKIDMDKFGEGLERVYGKKPDPFCDGCGYRHAHCRCIIEQSPELDKAIDELVEKIK